MMDTHQDSVPTQDIPKGLMFKFPKVDYNIKSRGDGRDSSKMSFDRKSTFVCSILSAAWAGLVTAYGIGIMSTIEGSIASFVYFSLGMMILFPIALIWSGFFVYNYANQSHKASSAILDAARMLGSPALVAAEDVKTLSSSVGHELNKLRGEMRSVEDCMNGISKRIDGEINTLNESSDKLHQTLTDVSGTIRAERDAIIDLMQIIKKENNHARENLADRSKTHIQVNDTYSKAPASKDVTEAVSVSEPAPVLSETPEPIVNSNEFASSVSQPATTQEIPTVSDPRSEIESEAEAKKTPLQFDMSPQQPAKSSYGTKPESVILRRERQLYEGLCALTVDLNRELGIELPQNLWSRYMRGERHVFADHLFNELKSNFEFYRPRLESETLYKLCNQFVARFETLRERLFDEPDVAVSEFLENSGVGRIYSLLSVEYV